nr:putative RNA-dependent RNA polymerase [Leptosphaeria biglobosa mitovirus 10]
MSFLNLLSSQKIIELSEVLEVLVNPHIEDFDFEKSKFDLPLHSLLKHSLEALTLGIHPMDKFSKPELRSEIVEELLPHLSAVVLQEALMKIRTLNRDYEHLVKSGALSLYKGKGSSLIEAQFTGFFMDLIFDLSDLDISDKADEVEEILTSHAKYQHIPVEKALETLSMVESLIYKFTFKTELSRSKFEKDSSPILKLLRKSEGNILIPYWRIPN